MNMNSVRKRPTPSAPASMARADSSGPPMFAASITRQPSAVTSGWSCIAASAARRWVSTAALRSISASWPASGSQKISPRSPSMASSVTPSIAASSPEVPTTAGIPRARARMAAWAVRDPASSAMPTRSAGSSSAVTDGGRSTATAMDRRSRRGGAWPRMIRAIRAATSRTSAARAASTSSSIAASTAAACSPAARIAASAAVPSASSAAAPSSSPGSAAIMACASKISASSGRPALRSRSQSSESSSAACAADSDNPSSGRSGRCGTVSGGRQGGATATPGAAGTPRRVSWAHGFSIVSPRPVSTSPTSVATAWLRIVALGPDLDRVTGRDTEPHDEDNALGADGLLGVARHVRDADLRREGGRSLDEGGRRPGMEPGRIVDRYRRLRHRHASSPSPCRDVSAAPAQLRGRHRPRPGGRARSRGSRCRRQRRGAGPPA